MRDVLVVLVNLLAYWESVVDAETEQAEQQVVEYKRQTEHARKQLEVELKLLDKCKQVQIIFGRMYSVQ